MSRPVKLPGLSPVATGNPALDNLLRQMIERMDVREGARGDPGEKVVTHKEMKALGLDADQLGAAGLSSNVVGGSRGGVMVQTPGGSFTRVPYDTFADELRKTALYRDLMQSINSVNRFDGVPAEVRAILLSSLADEAAQWGAEIRRLDKKIQSETESLAYTVETITAAVSGAASGVREVSFASATANAATAGRITQVTARLDDVGGVGVEAAMTAVADRATGLEGKYTVKVNAGGAVAGFGLAASENLAGVTTSDFMVQANRFSLMSAIDFSQEATPSASAAGKTWYKPSTKVYYRATATGTGSWAPYTPVIPFGVDTVTNTTYINGNLRINAGGPTILDGIQGPAGAPGAAGARGSLTGYGKNYSIYAASWPDLGDGATTAAEKAGAVIWNMLNGTTLTNTPNTWHLRIGDTITLTDAATATTATTKYWGGTSWLRPGVVIDGNLLASGVITAGISLSTAGYVKADGAVAITNFAGYTGAGVFNDSRGSSLGVVGVSHASGAGAGVLGYGSGAGHGVWAYGYGSGGALQVSGNSNLAGALAVSGAITITYPNGLGAPIIMPAGSAVCTNLNANKLEGNLASAFATSGHTHSGYAATGHAHSEYATTAALAGYALSGHAHATYVQSTADNVTAGNPGTAFNRAIVMVIGGTAYTIPAFA